MQLLFDVILFYRVAAIKPPPNHVGREKKNPYKKVGFYRGPWTTSFFAQSWGREKTPPNHVGRENTPPAQEGG